MGRCGSACGDDVDLVNGYKISRSDPLHRIVIGRIYHHTVKLLFGLQGARRRLRLPADAPVDLRPRPAREEQRRHLPGDDEEDFTDAGFRIAEVPVHHYHRAYGKSQFFNFPRIARTAVDVLKLWFAWSSRGVISARHRRRSRLARPGSDRIPPRFLPRPPGDDHRRPRLHRQQPGPPAGDARRTGDPASIRSSTTTAATCSTSTALPIASASTSRTSGPPPP